jgi:hypothetical protein
VVGGQVASQVGLDQLRAAERLLCKHAIAVCRVCQSLSSAHYPAQVPLDPTTPRSKTLKIDCISFEKPVPERFEVLCKPPGLVAPHKEAHRPHKVCVVVLVRLRFLGKRVHLVRRRREQEHLGRVLGEEVLCQFCGRVVAVKEVSEPLKLVEDDEVGLKRVDA